MAPLTHLMEGWFSGRQVGKVGMAPLTHLMEGWFSGRQVGKVGMATLTHLMEGWFSGRQVGKVGGLHFPSTHVAPFGLPADSWFINGEIELVTSNTRIPERDKNLKVVENHANND